MYLLQVCNNNRKCFINAPSFDGEIRSFLQPLGDHDLSGSYPYRKTGGYLESWNKVYPKKIGVTTIP
jgi:hypothetical protein